MKDNFLGPSCRQLTLGLGALNLESCSVGVRVRVRVRVRVTILLSEFFTKPTIRSN